MDKKMNYFNFSFQIFGKVQGVFFRKFTKEQADKLGLKGWVTNLADGTVQGQAQGAKEKCLQMY